VERWCGRLARRAQGGSEWEESVEPARFPPDLGAAGDARCFVRAALSGTVDSDCCEQVVLPAHELVINAIQHGRTAVQVRVRRRGACVRVDVDDGNPRLPSFGTVPVTAISGRGLAIVEGMTDRWGVDSLGDAGKTVWFETRCE
jgi:hypothetical protein